MVSRFADSLRHGARGWSCACHSPAAQALCERLEAGLPRRSVLMGLAAGFVAAANSAAFAQGAAPTRFTNVRIFEGTGAALVGGRDVLVEGRFIKALIAPGEAVEGARAIDCGGRTLMPGMIDAHWHAIMAGIPQMAAMTADIPYVHLVAAQEAERTLLRGFTTVRDVGGPAFALKRVIDEGRVPGPRIYPSGAMISQTSGHGDFRMRTDIPSSPQSELSLIERAGIASLADGEAEVLKRVREQLMLGASQIKIHGGGGVASAYDPIDALQYTDAEMKAAVAATSDWGTYVCIHTYTAPAIHRALNNGVLSIEHGQLADEDAVKHMAAAGAWWSIQPFLADEDANTFTAPEQRANQQMIAEGTIRAIELGRKHSVNLALGTDILFSPAGTATQGRQLAKFAQWLGNAETLRLLTSGNARLAAMSGPRNPYPGLLGRIEAGAYADILVIDGNPLEDIALIGDPERTMKIIMKDGRIHKDTLSA